MNPLNYIVSNNGLGIAVGIVGDKQLAHQDATLAENIYGFNHSDHLFDSIVYMPSIESFKKFLIIKEYFRIWDEHFTRNKVCGSRSKGNIMKFTRRAINRAKIIMSSQVKYENFMYGMSARNNEYNIGGYQDEASEE